jgi:hypothetical protein
MFLFPCVVTVVRATGTHGQLIGGYGPQMALRSADYSCQVQTLGVAVSGTHLEMFETLDDRV